jgi:hypothetical protein
LGPAQFIIYMQRRNQMSAISKAPVDITTKSRHRTVTAVTLGALAAMLFVTGDALAQSPTREAAASVTSRTPYQAYLAAGCIDGSNFCRFEGENVLARGLLEIQRVACQGWHTNALPPSFVVMAELRTSADVFVARIDFLKLTPTPVSWGTVWAISEQTLMFIPAGHRLEITLNSGSTGVGSYGCTISGYMTGA